MLKSCTETHTRVACRKTQAYSAHSGSGVPYCFHRMHVSHSWEIQKFLLGILSGFMAPNCSSVLCASDFRHDNGSNQSSANTIWSKFYILEAADSYGVRQLQQCASAHCLSLTVPISAGGKKAAGIKLAFPLAPSVQNVTVLISLNLGGFWNVRFPNFRILWNYRIDQFCLYHM